MIMFRLINKEPLCDYREACQITQGVLADYSQPAPIRLEDL